MSDHTAIFSNYVISEDTTNDLLVVEKKDTGDTIEIDGKSFDGGSGVTFEFDTTAGTTSLVNSDGTDALVVNDGGPVEVTNVNLNVKDLIANDDSATLVTSGSGTGYWRLRDGANAQDLLVANEGGPVEVLNTNQKIQERSSTLSYALYFNNGNGNNTYMRNDSGEITATDGAGNTTTLT